MLPGKESIDQAWQICQTLGKDILRVEAVPEPVALQLTEKLKITLGALALARGKVWLRTKPGTDMAHACLEAAQQAQHSLEELAVTENADAGPVVERVLESVGGLEEKAVALKEELRTKIPVIT